MKKLYFAILCLILVLTFLLCSCSVKGTPSKGKVMAGNVPATNVKRDETTKEPHSSKKEEEGTAPQKEIKPVHPGKTFTGRAPLSYKIFSVSDPQNSRGLPTKSIEHSFGISKNAVPHDISVNAQKFFDDKNFNACCLDNKSKNKVLYLTFDCGWENGYTNKILDILKEKKVPAAFFCTLTNIKSEPELIARMINEGHIIGNHSDTHPRFSSISRTKMAAEIANCDNYLRVNFGYTSPFFRFPEGNYSECALDLVESLGYKSVFWSVAYSDWDVKSTKGKQYAFDTVTSRLHPGAIILLHSVSPDNAASLGDIIDWARQNGYEFKSLTDLPK